MVAAFSLAFGNQALLAICSPESCLDMPKSSGSLSSHRMMAHPSAVLHDKDGLEVKFRLIPG